MNFQVETDTAFVDLSKNQIKLLHDEIFGQLIRTADNTVCCVLFV